MVWSRRCPVRRSWCSCRWRYDMTPRLSVADDQARHVCFCFYFCSCSCFYAWICLNRSMAPDEMICPPLGRILMSLWVDLAHRWPDATQQIRRRGPCLWSPSRLWRSIGIENHVLEANGRRLVLSHIFCGDADGRALCSLSWGWSAIVAAGWMAGLRCSRWTCALGSGLGLQGQGSWLLAVDVDVDVLVPSESPLISPFAYLSAFPSAPSLLPLLLPLPSPLLPLPQFRSRSTMPSVCRGRRRRPRAIAPTEPSPALSLYPYLSPCLSPPTNTDTNPNPGPPPLRPAEP